MSNIKEEISNILSELFIMDNENYTSFIVVNKDEITDKITSRIQEFRKNIELEIIKHPLGNSAIGDVVYNVEF